MPSHVDEQIYVDDINEQEEMSLDCWRVTYNFYQRLQHQGAPTELMAKMLATVNCFANAHGLLKEIRTCFPPRDGIPEPGE
jgi:hypothetical protein